MFKVALKEVPSPHAMEREPRYMILLNGKAWEPHGPRSGEIYFNMTGYRGAIPTITGAAFDPGERGISVFRKEVARINKEAAELIEKQSHDRVKVVFVTDTVDPRYAKLRFSDGTDGFARKAHLANLTMRVTGMGESLARQISTPELPKVYPYEAKDAAMAVLMELAPKDDIQAAVQAIADKEGYSIMLRLRSLAARLEDERPQGDRLHLRGGILRRWIDEEALPRHAAVRKALTALQEGNTHADPRAIGFNGAGCVEAREAEDAAGRALAALDLGAVDLPDRIQEVIETFQAIPAGAPRDDKALEALVSLVEDHEPEDETVSVDQDGPGF